jgi:predicted MFS family arabinose efflux permease
MFVDDMNAEALPAKAKHNLRWPLQLLNFFMADLQAGIGPFLGIFLLAHGWKRGAIGSVMTIGGVAGMLMTAPAGALIDETKHKRTYIIIPVLFTILASMLILVSQKFWIVSISQAATSIAGSIIGPAVIGITLVSILLWLLFSRSLKEAYDTRQQSH